MSSSLFSASTFNKSIVSIWCRLMTSEIVVNTLPRDRTRADVHHHPQYYRLRNHLVDFLTNRAAAPVREAPRLLMQVK